MCAKLTIQKRIRGNCTLSQGGVHLEVQSYLNKMNLGRNVNPICRGGKILSRCVKIKNKSGSLMLKYASNSKAPTRDEAPSRGKVWKEPVT